MPSVLNPWVHDLSYMQQSVLLSAIRNSDGVAKRHPGKQLIKFYRRCVLLSAFDGAQLWANDTPGGGSFTGPVDDLRVALDAFIDARDEMSLHYYAHAMHAFQILGYKFPADPAARVMIDGVWWSTAQFWLWAYTRMAHALHLWPESEEDMDKRLGDGEANWRARNDPSSTCSD